MTALTSDIVRYRGDTVPDPFVLKDSEGVVLDISSGYIFLFTLNREQNPANADNQLYQLSGIVTDGPAGEFEFRPSAVNTSIAPAKYFYDVQVTDSGGFIKTVEKGVYEIVQDLTK